MILPSVAIAATLIWSAGQILIWYALAMNITAFILYGHDKSAARRGTGRVPEVILHLVTFAGATPAALLAGRLFRHKTRKARFQAMYWLAVALHVGLAAWGAAGMISAQGWRGPIWVAFVGGLLAAMNVAGYLLEPKRRRRGRAERAILALVLLGGALGAVLRDLRGHADAWVPYLAGTVHLGIVLWPALTAIRAWVY